MQYLAYATLCILFVALLFAGLHIHEEQECNKWKLQAEEFSSFYLTQWQADQCQAHNISIDAPVR